MFVFVVFAVLLPFTADAACTVKFTADSNMAVVSEGGDGICPVGDTMTARSFVLDNIIIAQDRFCGSGKKGLRELLWRSVAGVYELKCPYIGADKEKRPQGVLITERGETKFSPLTNKDAISASMRLRYGGTATATAGK